MDVWLTKAHGHLWFVLADPGEPPTMHPRRAASVREVFEFMKRAKLKVGQVGIADSEMMGV